MKDTKMPGLRPPEPPCQSLLFVHVKRASFFPSVQDRTTCNSCVCIRAFMRGKRACIKGLYVDIQVAMTTRRNINYPRIVPWLTEPLYFLQCDLIIVEHSHSPKANGRFQAKHTSGSSPKPKPENPKAETLKPYTAIT